jgi:UDP-glucose 4-epimerase
MSLAVKVTVTGGAGFIGANLVRALVTSGHEVAVIDDLSTGSEANLAGLDVALHRGSILEPGLLADACDRAASIVHLAALGSVPESLSDPDSTFRVNVTGTLAVLQAARVRGAQVIFASSSAVYGANPALPTRETLRCAPVSPYGASKLAAESAVLAYQRSYRLPCVAFRFFNVYGPLQPADHTYAAVVPAFVSAVLDGRPVVVHGDGGQVRDFVSVGSVMSVIVDAIGRRFTYPDPINLAFGTQTSIADLLAKIEAVCDRAATVVHEPPRPGDVRRSQADATRLRQLFPNALCQPLEEGLRATVEWHRAARVAPV